jgi:hypothetical protein
MNRCVDEPRALVPILRYAIGGNPSARVTPAHARTGEGERP